MDSTQLAAIGQALYGREWQTALAKPLGINTRTVRRWVSGESPIPKWLPERLEELKKQRLVELKGTAI